MAKLPAPLAAALTDRRWSDTAVALERAATAKEPITTASNLGALLAWALVPAGLDTDVPLEKDSMTAREFQTTRNLVTIAEAQPIFEHLLPTVLKLNAGQALDPVFSVLSRWVENRRNHEINPKDAASKAQLATAVMTIAEGLVTSLPRKEAQLGLGTLIESQVSTVLNTALLDRLTDPAFLDVLATHRLALSPSALLAHQSMWLDADMTGQTGDQEEPLVVQARAVERLLAHPAHLQLVRTELNPITNLAKALKGNFEISKACALMLVEGLTPIYEARNSAYTERLKALAQAPAFERAISTGRLEALQQFLEKNPGFSPEGGWDKALLDVSERLSTAALQTIATPQLTPEKRGQRIEQFAAVLEFVLLHWTDDQQAASKVAVDLNTNWKRRMSQSLLVQDIAKRVPTMTAEERHDASDRLKALDANPFLDVLRQVAGSNYRFSPGEVMGLLENTPAPSLAKRPGMR